MIKTSWQSVVGRVAAGILFLISSTCSGGSPTPPKSLRNWTPAQVGSRELVEAEPGTLEGTRAEWRFSGFRQVDGNVLWEWHCRIHEEGKPADSSVNSAEEDLMLLANVSLPPRTLHLEGTIKPRRDAAALWAVAWLEIGGDRCELLDAGGNVISETDAGDDWIEEKKAFTFSADPAVEVLQLHWSGGLRMDTVEYSLLGDGRLRKVRRSRSALHESEEVELSYGEAEALLRLAVDGGLMEWDWDRLRAQFVAAAGHEPAGTDSRILQFRIVLETYSGIMESHEGSIAKTFSTSSPALLRREAPEIREIAALDELSQQLARYFGR